MLETIIKANYLDSFISEHRLPAEFADTAKQFYIPLAKQLRGKMEGNTGTFFLGVNGCQGSGKSTMSAFIAKYLQNEHGLTVAVLSLDDFYLTRQQRQDLAVKVHPLFATRGVPGTHNTDLLNAVLSSLSGYKGSISLPRFNKAVDNPLPQSDWTKQALPVDIVIMEGWCWGVPAQPFQHLKQPVNDLESQQDPLGVWRNYVNTALEQHYCHLYDYMDYWVMLKAPGFQHVYDWRLEQEAKLRLSVSSDSATHLMSAEEIEQFIQFYQRLTEHGLETLPDKCNVVFELDKNRKISKARGLC